jgi:hypothetical protein
MEQNICTGFKNTTTSITKQTETLTKHKYVSKKQTETLTKHMVGTKQEFKFDTALHGSRKECFSYMNIAMLLSYKYLKI